MECKREPGLPVSLPINEIKDDLFYHIKRGECGEALRLLLKNPELIKAKDNSGTPLLIFIVKHSEYAPRKALNNLVNALLERPEVDLLAATHPRGTVLHEAAYAVDEELFVLIALEAKKRGVAYELIRCRNGDVARDGLGETPLDILRIKNNFESERQHKALHELWDAADVCQSMKTIDRAQNRDFSSVVARISSEIEEKPIILNHHSYDHEYPRHKGATPLMLMLACLSPKDKSYEKYKQQIIRWIKTDKIFLDESSVIGDTLLHVAYQEHHFDIAREILESARRKGQLKEVCVARNIEGLDLDTKIGGEQPHRVLKKQGMALVATCLYEEATFQQLRKKQGQADWDYSLAELMRASAHQGSESKPDGMPSQFIASCQHLKAWIESMQYMEQLAGSFLTPDECEELRATYSIFQKYLDQPRGNENVVSWALNTLCSSFRVTYPRHNMAVNKIRRYSEARLLSGPCLEEFLGELRFCSTFDGKDSSDISDFKIDTRNLVANSQTLVKDEKLLSAHATLNNDLKVLDEKIETLNNRDFTKPWRQPLRKFFNVLDDDTQTAPETKSLICKFFGEMCRKMIEGTQLPDLQQALKTRLLGKPPMSPALSGALSAVFAALTILTITVSTPAVVAAGIIGSAAGFFGGIHRTKKYNENYLKDIGLLREGLDELSAVLQQPCKA